MATRVFISWSGEKSRGVAVALRKWLPKIIQSVDPFMSSADIAAGSRPLADIEGSLEDAKFGIICVSSDNWDRPWLNFEAGAISKRLGLEETRVSPLLIDLQPGDIDSPLKQFQMKYLDRGGVFDVVSSLNALCGDGKLADEDLRETFDVWWPRLEGDFDDARAATPPKRIHRGQEAKIDELLGLVRSLSRRSSVIGHESSDADLNEQVRLILRSAGIHSWGSVSTDDSMRISTPTPLDRAVRQEIVSLAPNRINFSFDVRPTESITEVALGGEDPEELS